MNELVINSDGFSSRRIGSTLEINGEHFVLTYEAISIDGTVNLKLIREDEYLKQITTPEEAKRQEEIRQQFLDLLE